MLKKLHSKRVEKSGEDVDKTTLETSEEDVDKTTLETSVLLLISGIASIGLLLGLYIG
jgi:hypothetical protein